jgi:hypothetical protein
MKTIEIRTQQEFDALKNEDGDVVVKANLIFFLDIFTGGGYIDTCGGYIFTVGGSIFTLGGNIFTGGGSIDTGGGSIFTGGGSINGHKMPSKEQAEKNLRAIAPLALAEDGLEMSVWHTCETTHCLAGWGQHKFGTPEGVDKCNVELIGRLHLGNKAASYFYKSNDKARSFLQQYL